MDFASYNQTLNRFDRSGRAEQYPAQWNLAKWRHRQEQAVIEHGLRHVTPAMKLLDLPCGTGRLTRLLLNRCREVTAADVSSHMVDRARQNLAAYDGNTGLSFERQDVTRTHYDDKAFDAVLCYRLMHHFHEPELRRQALRELGRICKGPILVSMFTSSALDYYIMLLKHVFKRNKPLHRSYIPHNHFHSDVALAGLEVVEATPRMAGISPLWLYVLKARN